MIFHGSQAPLSKLKMRKAIVLPMGFSPRQVRYGFSVTKEIDSKTFFGVKGFITRLVLPVVKAIAKISNCQILN